MVEERLTLERNLQAFRTESNSRSIFRRDLQTIDELPAP